MPPSRMLCARLVLLAAAATAARGSQPCRYSNDVLDCSFRTKTVLLNSETQDTRATIWRLRGNNLRRFPNFGYEVQYMDISNNELGLGDLEPLITKNLRYLDVSSNSLSNALLPNNVCSLNHFNISNNRLDNLTDIYGCVQLRTLRVANNKISALSEHSFYQWRYLELLDLFGNPIESITSTAFRGLAQLQTLHLSGSGLLDALPENTFSDSTALKNLFLNGNKLRALPPKLFQPLAALEELQLQNNDLQALPEGVFEAQLRLTSLVLDSNRLLTLPEGLFSRLHSLRELSARSNLLLRLPSLRECLGPLRAVLFNDNHITHLEEAVARSYFRFGFELCDLRGNPLRNHSMDWTSAADVVVWREEYGACGTIALTQRGHGSLAVCSTDLAQDHP